MKRDSWGIVWKKCRKRLQCQQSFFSFPHGGDVPRGRSPVELIRYLVQAKVPDAPLVRVVYFPYPRVVLTPLYPFPDYPVGFPERHTRHHHLVHILHGEDILVAGIIEYIPLEFHVFQHEMSHEKTIVQFPESGASTILLSIAYP